MARYACRVCWLSAAASSEVWALAVSTNSVPFEETVWLGAFEDDQ